jgi:outer membrane protein OmpA-like peptidoglycan-associated protein
MKKITLSILAIGLAVMANAQSETEMVENGSFEQIEGKIKKAGAIEVAVGWMSPTKTNADLYASRVKEGFGVPNNPRGREDAHDGKNYVGIKTFSYGGKEARTYVSTKLKTPMRKGLKYAVKFYVSLAEGSKYAANNIAANFSKKQYNIDADKTITGESHVMHVENPVFNAMFGWDEVCGVYTATGGERFLTVGNFSSDYDTKSERIKKPKNFSGQQVVSAYYYLDNISVELIENEEDCECQSDKDEVSSTVYAVTPVNPEGMTDQMIIKYSVVYFKQHKFDLEEGSEGHLDNVANVLVKDPAYKLVLYIHMDKDEVEAPKVELLDKKRAEEIKKYLVAKGVDGGRITFQLIKNTKPKDTSGSDLGKAKNRRVSFTLSK